MIRYRIETCDSENCGRQRPHFLLYQGHAAAIAARGATPKGERHSDKLRLLNCPPTIPEAFAYVEHLERMEVVR